jgi:hypothetical protein
MANSKIARRILFSGASPTNGIKTDLNNGGGMKKGGAFPSGTGQTRSFAMRSVISEPAKRKEFVLNFKQYVNPARHAGPML